MHLTAHFTYEELIASDIALRRGLDNTPAPEEVSNLVKLARGLEQVRSLLGHPMDVRSGYRSKAVNDAVGSSDNSHHRLGLAADFVCPGFGPPKEVCKAIRDSDIEYNQLIYEGTWVHISFADPVGRKSILTAHFGPGGVSYTEGIV